MDFTFILVDRQGLEPILNDVFAILYANMTEIAPTGAAYEEDYSVWHSYILPAMEEDGRRIVLMFCDGDLAGYFQYSFCDSCWIMEEIQIKRKYQGSGLFRELYRWLEPKLPSGLTAVEAYSNKANLKSQGILESLGLSCVGENPSASLYLYRGGYDVLWKKMRDKRCGRRFSP